jgi:PAS domain S-box-containing protein
MRAARGRPRHGARGPRGIGAVSEYPPDPPGRPASEAEVAPPLLGSTGIGTAMRDLATGERRWDATMKSIFGLPPRAPTPTHAEYLQLLVAEDRDRVDAEQRRLGVDDSYLETAYRIRTAGGELRYILSRSAVQFDESGRPRRVLTAAIDQTAARHAHAALYEAHERLRLAAEASAIGFWEREPATGVGRWDEQMFRFYGLPAAAAAPPREAFMQLIHADDRPLVEAAWQQIAAGQPRDFEFRVVRADGTLVQLISRGRALPARDGRPLRVIGTAIDVTEARRAERERADLVARLQLATTTAGIGMWERDPATGAETWDARMREMYGVGETFAPTLDGWLPQVIPELRAAAAGNEQRLDRGRPGAHEFTIVRPDGETRTIVRNAMLVRDTSASAPRLLGTALDVTDTRRAQRERDELSARMQLVADTVGLGVWDWDLLAEASVWNDQVYALHGRTRAQFRDLIWLDVVHPDDVAAARAARDAALAAGSAFDLEYRVLWPDGSVHWLATRGRIERDAVGNAVRMLGVTWDVSRRHETEARLRDALERLSLTTASTGIGLWTVDLRNGRIEWDAQMRRLYGLAADAAVDPARAWVEMTHPQERETVLAVAMKAVQRSEPLDIDLRIVRGDGEVRTLAYRAQIQRDAAGAPIRQLGVCWDITERLRAEEALREKAAAEQASRAKSEFLSRVSHELRTPLNAILGFAQILDMDRAAPLAPVQRERLAQIARAGRHLLALINDVLDLSRIEAGAEKLNMRPTELRPLVEGCLALVGAQAAAQAVALRGPPSDAAAPRVWVDATRLQQVLLNLLSNAIKYNRAGGQVEVGIEQGQPGFASIRVADTGAGMDEAQLAQLFQPFNRLGREGQAIPGAGIGLAISQRLVEQMGGTLAVRSQRAVGSEFTVSLRLAAGAGASSAGLEQAETLPLPRADVRGRVLYVEDDASNRALVEALLALRPSVQLVLAEDGAGALQLAGRQHFDLALIDVGLPDMSGIELLERLRALPHLRELPCVAVSANALTHEVERAMGAGFNDYWTKPLQATRFLHGLDDLLVGQGAAST